MALEYSKTYGTERVRVLTLRPNQGKGGAVQQGMLCARGRYVMFADADGATQFSDLDELERRLRAVECDGLGIAVGSRAHLEEKAIATVGMSACYMLC